MENKQLGIVLIIVALLLGGSIGALTLDMRKQMNNNCSCTGTCPHAEYNSTPIYGASLLLGALIALGGYLIFFEKSQKEIIKTLEKQKIQLTNEEKFSLILKGLDSFEKKVITAVKNQDGISQNTLRLRTDMHKSKLSLVLVSLEKKGLIKKVQKGKTNQVYLNIAV